jgi:hypothetical protein
MAFVMVLSYSRHLFLRIYFGAAMANFLRGHVEAFTTFNACPRIVLYDNLKSAVLFPADSGGKIRARDILMGLKGGRLETILASPCDAGGQKLIGRNSVRSVTALSLGKLRRADHYFHLADFGT